MGQGRDELFDKLIEETRGHPARRGQNHDTGGPIRREAQDMREIQIQRDQDPTLCSANPEKIFIARAVEPLRTDGGDIVAGIFQTPGAASAEIFVQLESHAAAFVSAGMMRSRAISAP